MIQLTCGEGVLGRRDDVLPNGHQVGLQGDAHTWAPAGKNGQVWSLGGPLRFNGKGVTTLKVEDDLVSLPTVGRNGQTLYFANGPRVRVIDGD